MEYLQCMVANFKYSLVFEQQRPQRTKMRYILLDNMKGQLILIEGIMTCISVHVFLNLYMDQLNYSCGCGDTLGPSWKQVAPFTSMVLLFNHIMHKQSNEIITLDHLVVLVPYDIWYANCRNRTVIAKSNSENYWAWNICLYDSNRLSGHGWVIICHIFT